MKRRYKTIILSFILPYSLIVAVVFVSLSMVIEMKNIQNRGLGTLYQWTELRLSIERKYWFFSDDYTQPLEEGISRFDSTIKNLKGDFPFWLMTREIKEDLNQIIAFWDFIKTSVEESENYYADLIGRDLGRILREKNFFDIIMDAYYRKSVSEIIEDDISVIRMNQIYQSMDLLMRFISSESYFEEKLTQISKDIDQQVNSLMAIVLSIAIGISFLIIYASLYVLRVNLKEAQKIEENMSTTLDSIGDAMIVTSFDGFIRNMNPSAESLTGWTQNGKTNLTISQVFRLIDKESGDSLECPVDIIRVSSDKETLFDNAVLLNKQDQKIPISYSASPVYEEGDQLQGVVLVFRDISRRVRMEEMMIQNEKMLSLGGLAAGMAHEINNPLAGMLQTANVLSNRLNLGKPFKANSEAANEAGTSIEAIKAYMDLRSIPEMFDKIKESGQRVTEIVENMLGFARKSDNKFTATDLPVLLERTIKLASSDYNLKKHYDFRQIEIYRDYDEMIQPVYCDEPQIQQVLLNLLVNSTQAMQSVETENPSIHITIQQTDEGFMRIELEDNGPGIPQETLKRIFEPFFTTKETGIGTGLGLSVSYFIITEIHQGTISVDSTLGQGTKFTILLPLERL